MTYELGIRTIAVYTPDGHGSLHHQKADEAYEIGEAGHPVRTYLDAETLVETVLRVEADAIYPGYGFLSESAEFARACEEGWNRIRRVARAGLPNRPRAHSDVLRQATRNGTATGNRRELRTDAAASAHPRL